MGKKKSSGNIQKTRPKEQPKKQEIKYEEQQDVTLTMYTLLAMLAIAASGVATALAGAIWGNPIEYGVTAVYKKVMDPALIEIIAQALFEGELGANIKTILLVSVILVGVAAVISLVDMIRAMAPDKKPMPLLSWLALVFSVAAVVLYIIGSKMIYDNCSFSDFEKGLSFNIYVGAAIAHGVNLVFMIANIVGNYMGLKRFKKDGKAY